MSHVESLLFLIQVDDNKWSVILPVRLNRDGKRQKTSATWIVIFAQIFLSPNQYESVINYLSSKQGISQKVFDFRE